MAAGDFFVKAPALSEQVGGGVTEGQVVVDQAYAAPLERGFWETGPLAGHANHPRHGGETHYLRNSLHDNYPVYMQRLADDALEPEGLYRGMVDNVEYLSSQEAVRALVEFGNLRASAHPTVSKDGVVVYDRPPAVPRLTRDELKAERRRGDASGRRPRSVDTNPGGYDPGRGRLLDTP